MPAYFAAFLRGVNVNGNKIPMDALKTAFTGLGFSGARTVLNTGNVVFASDQPAQELKLLIENGLKSALGYDAPIYLRGVLELEELQNATRALAVPEGCHLYLLLCDDAMLPVELGALFAATPHGKQEQFYPAEGNAFWIVPKGETLSSAFGGKVLGAKQYKARLTSRNWNTIEKIIGLMRQ
ncbi:DUF1697 domain-containing protein [Ethanoligenens harbinense]|uniref:DUF1697 domain-containing protein n=1 Tax=Ethanoligenens harbinense (strain DSM 18485 / JCM 12961 / CGMCC 1.5033 / YUAN-3) TaxID=663278 RepID=E6U5R5_ETHHY|nr:DUF1697 domain-containing protein [Ethanoligenens harbinense]ADU26824.1 protein of unknown function DUF1697 [Ethanoligenens harbinense YUAN-3]